MRKTIDIDKSDQNRILHTEVLPYEVPLFFSNDKFYAFINSFEPASTPEIIRTLIFHDRYTIPFEYDIRHGTTGNRSIAIIHPATQIRFAKFYSEYDQLILSLCGRSDYSLRAPFRVATHFIDRNIIAKDNSLNDGDVATDADGEDVSKFASSYFSYAKYSQLHRFIDSPEFLSLEAKFSKLLKFDVKKCFASIYTHSIAWAIKDKEYAKANKAFDSFEQDFDKLMRHANFDETNGIVVGPEVSRIFAEIILQRVDLNIANTLNGQGTTSNSFAIRRYIDDYFVFANDEKTLQDVFAIAQAELQYFKLYVNEAKTTHIERPFSSPQTAAKSAVQEVLSSTLLAWLKNVRQSLAAEPCSTLLPRSAELQLSAPFRLATRIARDLKIAVKQADVDFAATTGYALGAFAKELWRLRKALDTRKLSPQQIAVLSNLCTTTIEILMFFLSMDFRVRPSIRVVQCMVMLCGMTKLEHELNANISERFVRRVHELLIARSIEGPGGIEALNLLASTKVLRSEIQLSQEALLSIVVGSQAAKTDNPYSSLTYFDIVSILFYVTDEPSYSMIRSELEREILERFKDSTLLSIRAELCMLFMDIVRCPWITRATKESAISSVFRKLKNRDPRIDEVGHVRSFISSRLGFVDWNGMLHFERILNRKELKTVYDM